MPRTSTALSFSTVLAALAAACAADPTGSPVLASDSTSAGAADGSGTSPQDTESDGASDGGPSTAALDSGATANGCALPPSAPTCPKGLAPDFAKSPVGIAKDLVSRPDRGAVRVDSAGKVHAVWTADQIPDQGVYYATNRTGPFVVEKVSQTLGLPEERSWGPDLAVDDCGRPTVTYLAAHRPAGPTNPGVRTAYVASRASGKWVREAIVVPRLENDPPAGPLLTPRVVLDGAGEPLIVAEREGENVTLIRRSATGSGFVTEVPTTIIANRCSSLPVATWSATLGLVLAYRAATGYPAVAWKRAGVWTEHALTSQISFETMDCAPDDQVMAVAADASGKIHVAWRKDDLLGITRSRHLFYAAIDASGAWSTRGWVHLNNAVGGPPRSLALSVTPKGEATLIFDQLNGLNYSAYFAQVRSGAGASQRFLHLGVDWSMSAQGHDGRAYAIVAPFREEEGFSLYTQACLP